MDKCFMVLGGGGMIGIQIAHQIARDLKPEKVVIVSLHRDEVQNALHDLRRSYPQVEFVGFDGDVFVSSDFARRDQRYSRLPLLENSKYREDIFADLFGDIDDAFRHSELVQLILQHAPNVIVDSINTATAISYQDVYTSTRNAEKILKESLLTEQAVSSDLVKAIETLFVSQYTPQLVRHVVFLNRAMREVGTRLYIKIGTTGTGGMGLNIPYTHGEDKPSAKLMSKTAIAFAHTGLLFLMARTEGGPIIKEIKPAAMVGWLDIAKRTIRQHGDPVYLYTSEKETLSQQLNLCLSNTAFKKQSKLEVVVADTGENGLFTKGEFEAITALQQMEFITPEEIAQVVALEIRGINTGKDIISAIDGAVMGATYRAGYLRHQALDDLSALEKTTNSPSIALGELGPPELSKLLWEAFLIQQCYKTLAKVLEYEPDEIIQKQAHKNARDGLRRAPTEISEALFNYLENNSHVRNTIVSTKIPILLPDGKTIWRGPVIRIPEGQQSSVEIKSDDIEKWANKGWVDLRAQNIERWQKRFAKMKRTRDGAHGKGSAYFSRSVYLYNEISPGEVVGWIFNNEMDGYRII